MRPARVRARRIARRAWNQAHVLAGCRVAGGRPPALIMGTARSGTSFTGATLGRAPNAAYLREPVRREVFQRQGFDAEERGSLWKREPPGALIPIADRAFSGRPVAAAGVTYWPRQFASGRAEVLTVKEVMPVQTHWLACRYGARVLLLQRHPAALLRSWLQRGWDAVPFGPDFIAQLDRRGVPPEVPARLGATFAHQEVAMTEAAEQLGERAMVVTFEELADAPAPVLRSAAGHLGLVWTPAMEQEVAAATTGELRRADGRHHLVRSATDRARAWVHELDGETRSLVRTGYIAGGGTLYATDW